MTNISDAVRNYESEVLAPLADCKMGDSNLDDAVKSYRAIHTFFRERGDEFAVQTVEDFVAKAVDYMEACAAMSACIRINRFRSDIETLKERAVSADERRRRAHDALITYWKMVGRLAIRYESCGLPEQDIFSYDPAVLWGPCEPDRDVIAERAANVVFGLFNESLDKE